MKFSTKHPPTNKTWWLVCFFSVFILFASCKKFVEPPSVTVTTVASGLINPMGIDMDKEGNFWVTEGETFNNDGKVWVVTPNGKKYPAIINLSAFKNVQSKEPQGTSNLLFDKGNLYVLSGDFLYRIDVSKFKPGYSNPIDASKLAREDIGSFVYSKVYPDSHAYNLTIGPDGDLYIADAGANAIVHRQGWNRYMMLADLPGFKNPTSVGPPEIQAVPTSIWWDGDDFLVTTLSGFPFVKGLAVIYRVSLAGKVSVYQKGLSTLVNLAPGKKGFQLAVHYGDFGPTGFVANTGSLLWVNGSTSTQLVGGLNMPVGIKQSNNETWFVTCMGDGTIKKVIYK